MPINWYSLGLSLSGRGVMSCPVIIASFDFSSICVLRKECKSGYVLPPSQKHKYRSVTAASFCTFFLMFEKWNHLRFISGVAKAPAARANGEQDRTRALGLTSTPRHMH